MKKRILLVEDVDSTRRAYKGVLESEGFEVHEAPDLEAAVTAIQSVAFHVVCIDLGLDAEDGSNYEGRRVLEVLQDAEPGTRAMIVSHKTGGRAFEIAIDAYEKQSLARYLRKGEFSPEEFVRAVRSEAEFAELGIFRHYNRFLDVLLLDLDESVMVDKALKVLRPSGGYSTLISLVNDLVVGFEPLRPHLQKDERCTIDDTESLVAFNVWSKALGRAIVIAVRPAVESMHVGTLLRRVSDHNLRGLVVETDACRQDFLD